MALEREAGLDARAPIKVEGAATNVLALIDQRRCGNGLGRHEVPDNTIAADERLISNFGPEISACVGVATEQRRGKRRRRGAQPNAGGI